MSSRTEESARGAGEIAALPKIELHLHLEGTIRPATLLELARRNGVALPATDAAGLEASMRPHDFEHFLHIYNTIKGCMRTSDDYALVVAELGAALSHQNIRYAEITFTPSTHLRNGVRPESFLDGLESGRATAQRDYGVVIRWVFDIARRRREGWEAMAAQVTDLAIANRDRGVVALGLGGAEAANPPELFASYFRRAKAAGLGSVPHAGEQAGPPSIWGAINSLGADRIGHGVRAIEDRSLINYLVRTQLPLEVNVTSNLRLGIYRLAEHPLRRLFDAGANVTISSDIPAVIGTTLTDELLLLRDSFSFSTGQLRELQRRALAASFLRATEKAMLMTVLA